MTLGISRRDFAELINTQGREQSMNVACSERHVARWEDGDVQRPTAHYRRLLTAIGAPILDAHQAPKPHPVTNTTTAPVTAPYVGSVTTAAEQANETTLLEALAMAVVGSTTSLFAWLPRLEDTAHAAWHPGQDGSKNIDLVQAAIGHLRSLDQHHGGFRVADPATELLRSIADLRKLCRDESADHGILVASADLARLVGWACHDAGDQYRARRFATLALVFARRAGAHSLVASILYVLGRISLSDRDPRTALRLFQLGQLPAQDASDSGESARLYANEAWAHAMMGDQNRMNIALSRAEDEMTRVGDIVAPWTRVFFTPGEFTGIQAVIYNEFAITAPRPASDQYSLAAIDNARTSLQASSPARPARSILFDNITVATACFRVGEIDAALPYARAAIARAEQVSSARVADRLQQMVRCATSVSPRADIHDLADTVRRWQPMMTNAAAHPTGERATTA
ncbi:hypothetical protein [Nocardia takedensis]|uniref:hypothetical protein n=1 Tax=Nocardia takedensis TaxID=259390 RepID=UPI00031A6949|nr:hypothetical protein [Nocardia takedensis]